jgi:cysteine-rich repeat protein
MALPLQRVRDVPTAQPATCLARMASLPLLLYARWVTGRARLFALVSTVLTFADAVAVCGDGTVSPSEQCDDGNVRPGDGCNATCAIERGFVCPDATACERESFFCLSTP